MSDEEKTVKKVLTDEIRVHDLSTQLSAQVSTTIEDQTAECSASTDEKRSRVDRTMVVQRNAVGPEKTEMVRLAQKDSSWVSTSEVRLPIATPRGEKDDRQLIVFLSVIVAVLMCVAIWVAFRAFGPSEPSVVVSPKNDAAEAGKGPEKKEVENVDKQNPVLGVGPEAKNPTVSKESQAEEKKMDPATNDKGESAMPIQEGQESSSKEATTIVKKGRKATQKPSGKKDRRIESRRKRQRALERKTSPRRKANAVGATTKDKLEILRRCTTRDPCRNKVLEKSSRLGRMNIAELRVFPVELDACVKRCGRK